MNIYHDRVIGMYVLVHQVVSLIPWVISKNFSQWWHQMLGASLLIIKQSNLVITINKVIKRT